MTREDVQTVYYAHPMSWYDTPAEAHDIKLLAQEFPKARVINPNSADFRKAVKHVQERGGPVMQIFADTIRFAADAVAYRSFSSGKLGAGVAREIFEAAVWGKDIWHIWGLDPRISSVSPTTLDLAFGGNRVMTVEQTREAIKRGML